MSVAACEPILVWLEMMWTLSLNVEIPTTFIPSSDIASDNLLDSPFKKFV